MATYIAYLLEKHIYIFLANPMGKVMVIGIGVKQFRARRLYNKTPTFMAYGTMY